MSSSSPTYKTYYSPTISNIKHNEDENVNKNGCEGAKARAGTCVRARTRAAREKTVAPPSPDMFRIRKGLDVFIEYKPLRFTHQIQQLH